MPGSWSHRCRLSDDANDQLPFTSMDLDDRISPRKLRLRSFLTILLFFLVRRGEGARKGGLAGCFQFENANAASPGAAKLDAASTRDLWPWFSTSLTLSVTFRTYHEGCRNFILYPWFLVHLLASERFRFSENQITDLSFTWGFLEMFVYFLNKSDSS